MVVCALVDEMLNLLVWRLGLALELVILLRAVGTKTLTKFPYFYAYLFCVFCVSTWLSVPYLASSAAYYKWYWPTQFATLVAGCGVILDIVRHMFACYPGAARVARLACLGIFGATFCYVGLRVTLRPEIVRPVTVTVELERDLRVIQVLLLATVLAIVSYYGIEIGRNVKGLVVGFGTYVSTSLIALALRAFLGARFNAGWELLQSGAYLFALSVWMVALWSYVPQPVPANLMRIQGDYDALAGATREALQSLRSYFRRTARS
jgi:hypothetical protein